MTYNPAIPQATDLISQSQSQILTNFSQADTAFAIDHTAFSVLADQGKHKKSTYYEQAVDPTTLINEIAVYTKDVSAITQLFLRRENNGVVIQLTAGDPVIASDGSTFLPGGIIIKWGQINSAGNPTPVLFATPFPTADTTTPGTNGTVSYTGLSATGFDAYRTGGGALTAKYIAIGN